MSNKNKLNFIFWGTPDVASETLEILKENGYVPSLIVTAPDAKKGRGLHMEASPVAIFAKKNKILCLKPEKLDEKFSNKLKAISYKLSIVVAYGKIIPENVINLPKFGSINIHYSLLPKYRGASPVESAILNGDTETGITIQKMEYKMDTGPIIVQEKVEIGDDEKAGDLRKRLIKIGGELLVKTLKTPSASSHSPFAGGEKQNESQATYCKKIKKEDGEIKLDDDPIKNYNKFRAYAIWPRTFFFKNGKRIIITDAILENNNFIIKKIIPEGGKEIDYKK
ncbi:MAG: methionyl-tRNA formyltransferase [Candidatus Paceibacterota bacterium]